METNKTNNQKEQANKDQQNIQIKNTQLNQNKKKESNNSANFKENTEKHMNSKKENNNNQAINSEPKLANLNNNSNNMVTSNNQLENQDKLKKKKKKKKKTKKILAQELAQRQREAELFNTTPKQKIYLSYRSRLIINVILCIVFLFISVNFIYNSMDIIKEENVTYSEKGTIDYKICLKENNFYESSCIDKDMSYIANLIKNIPLTFTYDFKTSKSIKLDAKYEVTANLVISNTEDSTNYFSKKYFLIPLTDIKENDSSYKLINQDINIDYEYYNNIANEFRSQYGVETSSYLNVSFNVYNESDELNMNQSTTTISIPLSQKSINIKMQANETSNNNNQELTKYAFSLSNIVYLVLGVISVVLSIIFIIKALRLYSKSFVPKNNYDKYISKILREYDRLIVETSSLPNFNDYNIIKINKFTELLDVRDNLHQPIMYYNVVAHQKCHLYILKDSNLYLLTLKDVDM